MELDLLLKLQTNCFQMVENSKKLKKCEKGVKNAKVGD
jgi:hypothetical protein